MHDEAVRQRAAATRAGSGRASWPAGRRLAASVDSPYWSGALRYGEAALLFDITRSSRRWCAQTLRLAGVQAAHDADVDALLVVAAALRRGRPMVSSACQVPPWSKRSACSCDRQHQPVVADAVAQHEAHRRLGHRAPRLEDLAVGRLQAEVDGLRERA